MNKFDLEKAKAGFPVRTFSGRDVRIVCFDRILRIGADTYPIMALVKTEFNEDLYLYKGDGTPFSGYESDRLIMKEEFQKKEEFNYGETWEERRWNLIEKLFLYSYEEYSEDVAIEKSIKIADKLIRSVMNNK